MISFDKYDVQRFAISSVGALAVSAACVFGAVAPVRAAAPASVADWRAQVERKIDSHADMAPTEASLRSATIEARFTADGDFAGAVLARSTGNRRVDREALRFARSISYPALPAAYRGQPQAVRVNLYYGSADEAADMVDTIRRKRDAVRFAMAPAGGSQIAAR